MASGRTRARRQCTLVGVAEDRPGDHTHCRAPASVVVEPGAQNQLGMWLGPRGQLLSAR